MLKEGIDHLDHIRFCLDFPRLNESRTYHKTWESIMDCEKEEHELLHEMMKKRLNVRGQKYLRKRTWIMLGMLFFIFTSFVVQTERPIMPEYDEFPKTWKCKNCGYRNYDGVENCRLCGEDRR